MAVYVDDMRAEFFPCHLHGRKLIMCHMMADTPEELLAMADRIGVARKCIQRQGTIYEHFDICQIKRALAVAAGAIETTQREMVRRFIIGRGIGSVPATQ